MVAELGWDDEVYISDEAEPFDIHDCFSSRSPTKEEHREIFSVGSPLGFVGLAKVGICLVGRFWFEFDAVS